MHSFQGEDQEAEQRDTAARIGFPQVPFSPEAPGGGLLQHLANWNWPARETWPPFLISVVFLEGLTTAQVLFGDVELWHK